jgi:glutamate dehydrogenase
VPLGPKTDILFGLTPTTKPKMSPALFPLGFSKSIAANLTPELTNLVAAISLPGSTTPADRVSAFLDRLFYRSPPEVMRRKTEEQVRHIALGCFEALAQQLTNTDRIAVSMKDMGDTTGIFIALRDHPFIISSLAERFYEAGIPLNCFQHPILSVHGTNIALSYIEVGQNTQCDIGALIPELRETLKTLVTIVGDHEQMLANTRGAAGSLDGSVATEWGTLSQQEVRSFLDWLADGSFFFIGVSSWNSEHTLNHGCGVWSTGGAFRDTLSNELLVDLQRMQTSKLSFSISKLQLRSPIHRNVPLLNVLVKPRAHSSDWISIVGYLTSKAWAYEAFDIPIVRTKLHQLLATERTPPNSHDYKYVIEVIDNMPTDEALRMPIRDLQTIAQLALGVFSREDSRSVTCIDTLQRWALTTIVVPPERYSASMSDDVQLLIESCFGVRTGSSDIHLDSSKKRQLRLYISTPLPQAPLASLPDLEDLGKALQRATLSWKELLDEKLSDDDGTLQALPLMFPEGYQASVSVAEAAHDYHLATSVSTNQPLTASMFSEPESSKPAQLSFISLNSSISLSTAVPVLENIGLEVLDANSYVLGRSLDQIHILKCAVRAFDGQPLDIAAFNTSVAPGLVRILRGTAMSDPLNLLLRTKGLSIDQIALLRCYCAFLWQTYKIATKRTMWKALAYSPNVAATFVRYFETAFDPALQLSLAERKERCLQIEQEYQIALRSVRDVTHDRILKALLVLAKNTVRTNVYQATDTIALKVHAERVEFLPHPRPLYEIFVYSSRIEGTHLRSSKVARGGIRWSERLDDYRSEVLGLVKTQRVKNVIIVPSGAKGGFIVKNAPTSGEGMGAAVEGAYREYITALLSIADNLVANQPVQPPHCVIHDDFDPYFVVAADKGTATFSDTANSIATGTYSFWLGDAFASGGSQGYDHKKYGITARGGMECVQRHARDSGISTDEPFTTVGIGDMSGDVFGNAMILTSNMLLLGAFNHKHIFVDPNPLQKEAFQERLRLFSLPRSQWSDFNPAVISKGGGVFERFAKEIGLTREMRQAFGISDDVPATVDGETLISLILKAPVTLLWNGGIGTYVKARSESHSDVNDGANDAVRVNADELRCRIIGEGGNVGFTQRARIQCAQQGIKLNTDAIDNSGGVDLSDHEVNLKLLLSPLCAAGTITEADRNTLLKEIAPDVVESVLQHNRDQGLLLTVAESASVHTIEHYRALIREMHSRGFLDRTRDNLPDEQELDLRASSQRGMYRPELAICSAAVKMWLKDGLRSSDLLNDSHLEQYLRAYFPAQVQSKFHSAILGHSLRREIIANEIVHEATLAAGISFLPMIAHSTGASVPQAMKCLLAADIILGARGLRSHLRTLDTVQGCPAFIESWIDLSTALRHATSWLMQSHPSSSIEELVQLYGDSFSTLVPHARALFSADELTRFEKRVAEYQASGLPESDAVILGLLRRVHVALETLWCAREYRHNVKDVAATLAQVLDGMELQPLFKFEQALQAGNKWEQELAEGSFQEIRRELSRITGKLLSRSLASSREISATLAKHKQHQAIRDIMSEINDGMRTKRPFSISVLPLIARHLRELALFTV